LHCAVRQKRPGQPFHRSYVIISANGRDIEVTELDGFATLLKPYVHGAGMSVTRVYPGSLVPGLLPQLTHRQYRNHPGPAGLPEDIAT
jgi:hypothetical protein